MSVATVRAPHPVLAAWAALRATGAPRGALVTLVGADGGASKILGTQLALAEDGRAFGSVTIGGCADGRAVTAAKHALRSGARELLTLPLAEADARALGLGCAGDVELLVEPAALDANDPVVLALEAAAVSLGNGIRAALVTPLDGATGRLLVREDGSSVGTLGTPERDIAAAARITQQLCGMSMDSGIQAWDGERWFVQLLAPAPTVLVVGATDVAAALCVLAAPLAWHTVLIDARDDVLQATRFATASEREGAMPDELVAERLRARVDAVVVLAHDYKVEVPVLRLALRSTTPYIGMLASRKRAAAVRALLADDGVSADALARLCSPIGLQIGAQGPTEIAVSILAEVIAIWRALPVVARGP